MASLSVQNLGPGKYKIRWRELVPGDDGLPERGPDGRLRRRARSLTVRGKTARDEAVARIRRALLDEGEYQLPTAAEEPEMANLEHAALAWLEWKRTRCKPRSVVTYATHIKRFFEMTRQIRSIRAEAMVPGDVLTRDLLIECIRRWQELGRSEAWVYSASRSAMDLWRWVSDDPVQYPGVPVPPREAKRVLPRTPLYVAPPAPTMAELDACLRHISLDAEESRRVGVLLRFTGLRISQVLALRRDDIALEAMSLTVRIGKSRQEEAEQRTIPISRHLVAEIARWVAPRAPGSYLFPAWGSHKQHERHAARKNEPFHQAWASATKSGEARRAVWAPPNRRIARPQHAFRAGFQAFMRSQGIGEEVIDALVGHHGRSLRARHYAGTDSLWERMVEAMALLPVIDWRGPVGEQGSNVVELQAR